MNRQEDGMDHDIERPIKGLSAYVVTREEARVYEAFGKFIVKLTGQIDQLDITSSKGKKISPELDRHVHRLKTVLLPSLPRKFCQMCDMLFSPVYFLNLEAPQFLAALELLTEVEATIDEITSCVSSFWVTDSHQEAPVTHAENVKRYRCRRTRDKIVDLMDQVTLLLESYGALVPLAAMRPVIRYPATVVWRKLIEDTHCIRDCIDHLIKWFDLSDLGVFKDQWQGMANELDDLIDELDDFPYDDPHQSFEPLQAFIPILKLARLFFNKMSKPTNGEPHPISQMSFSQLQQLLNSTLLIPSQITNCYDSIETELRVPQGHINPHLALNLVSLFQGPLNILNDFLALQCADPHFPQDMCQKFIFWYADWQFQFSLAVRRFNTTYRDLHPHHFPPD